VNEYQALSSFLPARHGQWLALADALDAALITLHTAIPDPLWFGPSRRAFDINAELVMTELRQARWAVLSAQQGIPQ
jgi:hypothetical protein